MRQISNAGIPYAAYPSPDAAARAAAELFAGAAREAAAARGEFAVALSGGATPRLMHAHLAAEPLRDSVPWEKVRIFFGDERCVGPDHADSNFGMARETLLRHVPIPAERIHRMLGEAEDADAAAREYESALRAHLPPGPGGMPALDLILLGLGPDGHTASLFPGTAALGEASRAAVANEVPQLSARRLTLTFPAINAARRVCLLATGANKAERVRDILEKPPGAQDYPAGRVKPLDGELLWILDAASAGLLGT